jgi:hypothetical protein
VPTRMPLHPFSTFLSFSRVALAAGAHERTKVAPYIGKRAEIPVEFLGLLGVYHQEEVFCSYRDTVPVRAAPRRRRIPRMTPGRRRTAARQARQRVAAPQKSPVLALCADTGARFLPMTGQGRAVPDKLCFRMLMTFDGVATPWGTPRTPSPTRASRGRRGLRLCREARDSLNGI